MSEQNTSPTGNANGANGSPPPGDAATPPPSYDRVHSDRRAAGRAAFLESLKNGETPTPEAKPETPAASESPESADPDADADTEADTEASDVDTEPESEEPEAEPEPEPAAAKADEEPDADLNKRLESVQKAKKRALEEVSAAKVEVERHRQNLEKEYGPAIAELKKFEALKSRARVDFVSVARALGIDGDDLDFHARQMHAEWKAWKGDPTAKEQSAAVIRRRETETKIETMEREFREFKEEVARREQAVQSADYAQKYLAKVEKAVGDETPIVRSMMTKNAEKTRARLGQIAYDLASESGDEPTPAEVVKALEKIRREELEELGIDPASVAKAAKPKTKPVTAGETRTAPKKPAVTTANNEQPRPKRLTRDEVRAAFIKGQLGQ